MTKSIVKRKNNKISGLFIDGVALDRATRRLNRKVELSKLVKSLSAGRKPEVARYYTIVPFEDDSRHAAYLDAIERAGLEVVVKRLPPKGITRQVDIYTEMASDLVAFALGHSNFSNLGRYKTITEDQQLFKNTEEEESEFSAKQKVATVVCPGRELSYPLALIKELGVDTVSADFAKFAGKDVLKNAAKWIDLTDSEIIWRE